MARHARNTVIEDDADRIGFIIRYFREGIDTGMEEGGIAHDGYDPFLLAAVRESPDQSVAYGKGTAHAESHVFGIERFGTTQGIAADIADHDRIFALGQFIEEATVGTAGTESRRTGNE